MEPRQELVEPRQLGEDRHLVEPRRELADPRQLVCLCQIQLSGAMYRPSIQHS